VHIWNGEKAEQRVIAEVEMAFSKSLLYTQAFEMALGVHIGLAGFNVTLRTIDRYFDVLLDGGLRPIGENETAAPAIFYNEHVS
jgi:hypothetical protein